MMAIGFLRVSDVDDRTYVDCSTIPDMGMDKVRHLSRFWTSSALMSKLHPDQSHGTEVMGRISESHGFHMPVCWSIRLVLLHFVFVQSLRPKPGRSLHFPSNYDVSFLGFWLYGITACHPPSGSLC